MKNIMKRAHEIARTLDGHYQARMSFALRQAWKESKEESKEVSVDEIIEACKKSFSSVNVWEKYGKKRIYCESRRGKLWIGLAAEKGFCNISRPGMTSELEEITESLKVGYFPLNGKNYKLAI